MSAATQRATIVEVGPRDGLQSLDRQIDTGDKLAMIEALVDAGLRQIEVTSFAHPKMVPRLSDAAELMARLPRPDGVTVRALVPNRRGAERAIEAGADVLLGLLSASATYSERNQNMTINEGLAQLESVAELARGAGIGWAAAISMAFGSPYEDAIDPDDVLALVTRAAALEPTDLYVADTVGRASPEQVAALCAQIAQRLPELRLGIHLHGSDARGLACAVAAVHAGAAQVESSVLGLGGPVVRSPGVEPVGNLATEAVVDVFTALGIDTGLSAQRIAAAAARVSETLGVPAQADPPGPAAVAALIPEITPEKERTP